MQWRATVTACHAACSELPDGARDGERILSAGNAKEVDAEGLEYAALGKVGRTKATTLNAHLGILSME
jgi:hypothetical protein